MALFKNKIHQIDISNPCDESWASMTPVEQGRFCSSCQKCVTDFTSMSTKEIKTHLQYNQEDICGRIGVKQLKDFNHSLQKHTNSKWSKWRLAAATLTGLTFVNPVMGQNNSNLSSKPKQEIEWNELSLGEIDEELEEFDKQEELKDTIPQKKKAPILIEDGIVRGYVFDDETKDSLIGVPVIQKGTTNGTMTDFEGYFELKSIESRSSKDSIQIEISYVGYEDYIFSLNPN
ncbi:MAG: carboxypeptidase-like regulatory domain-containing protein, partial [Chitinophagales bacterium]